MSNPFKIGTGSLLFLLWLIWPAIAAEEHAARSRWSDSNYLEASQVVEGDYFAAGKRIEISGTVNGDLYTFGGQVIIDGRVNGDILAAGGKVTIAGTAAQDVRVAGGQVIVTGAINRNLTVAGGDVSLAPSAAVRGSIVAAGGNVTLAAPIAKNARVAAGTIVASGRIGGHLDAATGSLRITSRADIHGDVNYWSGTEASISEGARIGGKITRKAVPKAPPGWRGIFGALLFAWIVFVTASFISTLILGLLSERFLPDFHRSAVALLKQRKWACLGIGFIAVVVTPVVCALLLSTLIAIPLALILAAAYLILLYCARIFTISWIGETILGRLQTNPSRAWAFVLGLIIYYLLAAIPVIGWIVVPLAVLFGLGAALMARRNAYLPARV